MTAGIPCFLGQQMSVTFYITLFPWQQMSVTKHNVSCNIILNDTEFEK
jgi:hypothetical protein